MTLTHTQWHPDPWIPLAQFYVDFALNTCVRIPISPHDIFTLNSFCNKKYTFPNTSLLIKGLRTPFVVTTNPAQLPENCLGWAVTNFDRETLRHLGQVSIHDTKNFLYCQPLTRSHFRELRTILDVIQTGPYRVAVCVACHQEKSLLTMYSDKYIITRFGSFFVESKQYTLMIMENTLSTVSDGYVLKYIHKWLQNFKINKTFSFSAKTSHMRSISRPTKSTLSDHSYIEKINNIDGNALVKMLGYRNNALHLTKKQIEGENILPEKLYEKHCRLYRKIINKIWSKDEYFTHMSLTLIFFFSPFKTSYTICSCHSVLQVTTVG